MLDENTFTITIHDPTRNKDFEITDAPINNEDIGYLIEVLSHMSKKTRMLTMHFGKLLVIGWICSVLQDG